MLMRYGEEYVKKAEAEYATEVHERLEKQFHRRALELGYEVKKIEPPPEPESETSSAKS